MYEQLVEWIHRIGTKKYGNKRLHGFVTEMFFERVLARTTLGLKNPAFGWFYANIKQPASDGHLSESGKPRYWFKIDQNFSPNVSEQLLIKTLRSDNFFILKPRLEFGVQARAFPTVEFEIQQWGFSSKWNKVFPWSGEKANDKKERKVVLQLIESANLNATLEKMAQDPRPELEIAPWLHGQMNVAELESLFVSRCVLDYVLPYPMDCDAIDSGEGSLRITEFKRKYPTRGGWWIPKPECVDLYTRARQLQKKAMEQFSVNEALIREELGNTNGWVRIAGSGFGLDLPHVEAAQNAISNRVKYQYIIWNQKKTKLSELFVNGKLQPLDQPEILGCHLSMNSFKGLTVTPGSKSSSYGNRDRVQLVVPESEFLPVPLRPDQLS